MTVKDVILSHPALVDVSDVLVEKVLVDREVDGSVNYSAELKQSTELCLADLLTAQVSAPDFSEGNLSISQQRRYVLNEAIEIYRKYEDKEGLEKCIRLSGTQPTVTSRTW